VATVPKTLVNGVLGRRLRHSRFEKLVGDLKPWRADEDLRAIEAAKGSALVLPFVKGLHLSSQLIYLIRNHLSDTDLEVHWGHLLDPAEESCSPECDIIVHSRGWVESWNGEPNPIMDFKFIKCENAHAVVSCKSFAKDIDKDYARKLGKYIANILIFAECCGPKSASKLEKKAKAQGYTGFWYLYTMDQETGECVNCPDKWEDFLQTICRLVKRTSA